MLSNKCKDPAIGPVNAGAVPGPLVSQPGLEYAAGETGSEVHPFDGNEGISTTLKKVDLQIPVL